MDAPFPPDMVSCIKRFLALKDEQEPGRDLYQEVFDTDLFFPLQRQCELASMIRLARSRAPKVVCEIGADKGGGLYHWCKCISTVKRVIACEIRGLPYAGLFEKSFPQLDFLWLPESSYEPITVTKTAAWLGADKIDVLFIDGNKSFFLRDFDSYYSLMSDSSIVFMHDIQDKLPRAAFDEVVSRGYRSRIIVDYTDTEKALVRKVQGAACKGAHEAWLRHWMGRSAGVGVIYLEKTE